MKHLCAPWRSEYFKARKGGDCVFCDIINNPEKDNEKGVLFRGKFCFGVMNLFPYSPGAFLIIPYKHTANIEDLSQETWFEMSFYIRKGVEILKNKLSAGGVNIGMNLGKAAGAGIDEHVHYHAVPRWERDTNFITTIADVRVNGVPFAPIYKQIKEGFKEIKYESN